MLSCALITREAVPSVVHVHHRMPVILKPDHYSTWIDPQTSAEDVQAIIADVRQDFETYAVSTAFSMTVNRFRCAAAARP